MDKISSSPPNSLQKNAMWNTLSFILNTVITLIMTPFIINSIGYDDYGIYILLMSIVGLLGIMNFGLGEATLRYVAYYNSKKDIEGINRVLGATLSVYTISSIIICGLMCFASSYIVNMFSISKNNNELGVVLIQITAANFVFVTVMKTLLSIPQALERFDIPTKIQFIQSILYVIGTVFVIKSGYGIYGLLISSIITTILLIFVVAFIIKILIPKIKILPRFNLIGIKEIFSYGAYTTVSNLVTTLTGEADRLLLGILVSPASIGYLSVPKNLVFRVKEAVDYVGSTLFPKFSSMQDLNKIKAVFLDATWFFLSVTLVIFVPVVVLFPDLLRIWIGSEFSLQSSRVAQIIAFSYLVRGSFVPFQYLWRGLGVPKYNTVLYSVSGIASLVTSALLIPIYGLDGAGYCHAVTMLLGFGAIVFTWKKVFHEISLRPLFRPVGLPIIMGIIGLLISGFIRFSVRQPGLVGMIIMAAVFSTLSGLLIIAAEYYYGRGDSRSLYLFRKLRDYFPIIKELKIELNISRKP